MKYKEIVIQFDEENSYEDTITEVLRLVKQGYLSGINPFWEFK